MNKDDPNFEPCLVCGEDSHWGVIGKDHNDNITNEHFCDSCYNGIKRKTIVWPPNLTTKEKG